MTTALLKTKLHIPLMRPEQISRPRLIELLDAGPDRKLTLISAPAGSGKTTLLAEWVAGRQAQVGWLSLDQGDDEEARFWTYVAAALQTAQAGLGQDALRLLQAPQRPATQTVLTALLNQLAGLSQGIILVLDDYHLISERAVHEGLAFVLEHQPQNLHLVISTRADPPLPIYRLRARGQVTELRSRDLRFTTGEAAEFLNAAMGLDLEKEDVEALEARTEGWIAGLQLAALSLQGRADAHEFITAFSAGHHYVLEYLTNEIIRRQPEPVQHFLMRTSILESLSGPLCDAVTGEGDGEAMLAHLLQRNLFLLPLDDEHRWYRYHHLFADLLGNLRRKEWPPEYLQKLHLRASEWYDRHGFTADAVNHALAAGDFQRTGELIERHSLAMVTRGELVTLLRWIDALPEDVATSRPWLAVHQAWPLILAGKADDAEPLLQRIEHQVVPGGTAPDAEEILGHVAAMRALLAVFRGDMFQAVELAGRADELLPPDNLIPRHIIPFIRASAYLAEGELERAGWALAEELGLGRAAGNLWTVVRSLADLADVQIAQGRLCRASELCQEALQEAEARGARQFGTVGQALVKLGEILYERDDLDAARDYVSEAIALMQGWQQPYEMVSGYTMLATILQAQGDARGARKALRNAEEIQAQNPAYLRLDSLVNTCRVRLCLAQDGPEDAQLLATETQLGESGPTLSREQEQLILARLLVAGQEWDEALPLLAQMARAAEAGGRFGPLIKVLVLQAAALQAQGNAAQALAALQRALALGEPEGYVRVFVEQGPAMATLLQQAATRGIAPSYVDALVARLCGVKPAVEAPPSGATSLVEPLTARELEILQLIGSGRSNEEIAEILFITINTVKKHASNVYGKLGVHSRTQAIARAQELGLL